MGALNEITVVMPVYNEGVWVERAVHALEVAAQTAGLDVTVVVVDDGSEGETVALLDVLASDGRISLVRQENGGRFAARRRGLAEVRTAHTLLLDARVILHPTALNAVCDGVAKGYEVFNAHVDVVTEGNLWAAFWSGITKVGWRRYFARPRRVSFGLAEFDAYPKGTGAFFAPTALLVAASEAFTSLFADQRFASDDTRMLRNVAERSPITIDPDFRVDYFGRDSGRRWAKQTYFRGTTFVDGYLGDSRRALPLLVLVGIGVSAVAVGVIRAPRLMSGAFLLSEAIVALGIRLCGGDAREVRAGVALASPFGVIFGAGILRGLLMVARR